MQQPDLFSYQPPPRYPHAAGHRRVDTSVEAAKKVDERKTRKLECYEAILAFLHMRGTEGATTHELTAALGQYDYDYLQPRTSELFKLGKILDSGQRRKNAKGSTERVWIV